MPKRSSSSIFYCLHWCCICSVTTSLNRTDSILFWSRLIYYVVSSVFLMYFVSTIYYVFRYATISRHAKQFCVQNSRAMYLPNGKVLVHGKGMNVIMCPFMKTHLSGFWKMHSPVELSRHMTWCPWILLSHRLAFYEAPQQRSFSTLVLTTQHEKVDHPTTTPCVTFVSTGKRARKPKWVSRNLSSYWLRGENFIRHYTLTFQGKSLSSSCLSCKRGVTQTF